MILNFISRPIYKWVLVGLTVLLYIILGLVKWRYAFNFGIVPGGFLILRAKMALLMNNHPGYYGNNVFFMHPKWISVLVYGNLYLVLTMAIIFLIYRNVAFVKLTFWFFFWFSFLSILALLIGYLTQTFKYVAPIVARIKEIQQSPFTLIILIGIVEIYRKNEVQERLSDKFINPN